MSRKKELNIEQLQPETRLWYEIQVQFADDDNKRLSLCKTFNESLENGDLPSSLDELIVLANIESNEGPSEVKQTNYSTVHHIRTDITFEEKADTIHEDHEFDDMYTELSEEDIKAAKEYKW